ncbi:MAG: hypothetical protein V4459_05075 [Pseudomonadota bacterium]
MRSTTFRPGPDAAPSLGAGRRLALLWLVVALLFQGFVTQSHLHLAANRISATTGPATLSPMAAERKNPGPVAPVCPLCEEKALFGAYLLTGSISIVAPLVEAYRPATTSLSSLALLTASHAWRSRAPPISTI